MRRMRFWWLFTIAITISITTFTNLSQVENQATKRVSRTPSVASLWPPTTALANINSINIAKGNIVLGEGYRAKDPKSEKRTARISGISEAVIECAKWLAANWIGVIPILTKDRVIPVLPSDGAIPFLPVKERYLSWRKTEWYLFCQVIGSSQSRKKKSKKSSSVGLINGYFDKSSFFMFVECLCV